MFSQVLQFIGQEIVIVRHGKISVGSKVLNAQAVGIKGLLLYADPAEVANNDYQYNNVPQTWWMPSQGIRKDTVLMTPGDPLSPGFPSLRETEEYRLAMGADPQPGGIR